MNVPVPVPSSDQETTRQRLLDASALVFAEVGYREATVREICRHAGANVAAVNYHFGDKARLYSETLRHLANASLAAYPTAGNADESAPASQRLFAFVRSFLLRILTDDRAALYGQIIAREMVEPTHALEERINETIRPMAQTLRRIVAAVLGVAEADADRDASVRLGACSVVGQVVFYKHCRPIVNRLFPGQDFSAAGIDQLARHITDFSLAGLRAMRGDNAETTAQAINEESVHP